MYLLMLKSNCFCLLFLVLMSSCCSLLPYRGTIMVSSCWHTPLDTRLSTEDPACFAWWRALHDPLLTETIEQAACRNSDVQLAALQSDEQLLETVNQIAADIARTYIQLRGGQAHLALLQQQVEKQSEKIVLSQGLSRTGFIDLIEQNADRQRLDALLMQKTEMQLSIDKALFHLSTLSGYPPGQSCEDFAFPQEMPTLPCVMPVGSPVELILRHAGLREARKQYNMAPSELTFLNYKKQLLTLLEAAENGLAALHANQEKLQLLQKSRDLKAQIYQLIHGLYQRGLRDERDLYNAFQELAAAQSALIQGQEQLLTSYVNLYQALQVGWAIECQ